MISTSYADSNGVDSGSVYLVYGKASGFDATLDLTKLPDDAGFRIDGQAAGNHFGLIDKLISAAGDMNKDGFDDLVLSDFSGKLSDHSAKLYDSYVIFGHGTPVHDKLIKGTNKADMLKGTSAAERFEAGNGNDIIIGRGGADTYLAGNGNDYIRVSDLNFKLVDGGNGNGDTLAIAAVDANLDLAGFSGKIKGIEKIDLYGASGSDNGVTLDKAQLKALSNTGNKLVVNGNHGDYVHITDNGWHDKGIYNGFHTYTNADAQLLVGVNVMVDFV